MQAEKPSVHKRVHNVHTPFGRTNTRSVDSVGFAVSSYPRNISMKIQPGHVVTTTLGHE